jgi:hypothetical protein
LTLAITKTDTLTPVLSSLRDGDWNRLKGAIVAIQILAGLHHQYGDEFLLRMRRITINAHTLGITERCAVAMMISMPP